MTAIRRIVMTLCFGVGLCCAGMTKLAQAADVEVVGTGAVKSSIDCSGLVIRQDAASLLFHKTLIGDLERSGWFTPVAAGKGAFVVTGECDVGRSMTVRCSVKVRATGESKLYRTFNEPASEARALAHQVADAIVEAIKGVPGIASTRIAFVGKRGADKDIYVCDADGGSPVQVTHDKAPCLAPSWGPDGRTVVYTSFLGGYPDVYRLDLDANIRRRLAGFPGLNAGADISPDGRRMVLTLSKDGNPDLYVMDLRRRNVTRVTNTRYAAEASPSWSPDGQSIVFVSDRGRSPQLYIVSAAGGKQRRLVVQGTENVAPDWGPDGRIAFASRRGGRYQICVVNPDSGRSQQLTTEPADYEDPSWAPDGRHLVCSRTAGYRSQIYILDTLGDPPLRLLEFPGDAYSPAWSSGRR